MVLVMFLKIVQYEKNRLQVKDYKLRVVVYAKLVTSLTFHLKVN